MQKDKDLQNIKEGYGLRRSSPYFVPPPSSVPNYMREQEVKAIVKETIAELKRSGVLKPFGGMAYAEVSRALFNYYEEGEIDEVMLGALNSLESDPYFNILPMYFDYRYTLEKIAEIFNVEVSTVTRNKKRLCIAVYNILNNG